MKSTVWKEGFRLFAATAIVTAVLAFGASTSEAQGLPRLRLSTIGSPSLALTGSVPSALPGPTIALVVESGSLGLGHSPAQPLETLHRSARWTRIASWTGILVGVAAVALGVHWRRLDGEEADCQVAPSGAQRCLTILNTRAESTGAMVGGGVAATFGVVGLLIAP